MAFAGLANPRCRRGVRIRLCVEERSSTSSVSGSTGRQENPAVARPACRARPERSRAWLAGRACPDRNPRRHRPRPARCAVSQRGQQSRGLRLQRIHAVRVRASRRRASPRHRGAVRSGGRDHRRSDRGGGSAVLFDDRLGAEPRGDRDLAGRIRPRAEFQGCGARRTPEPAGTGPNDFLERDAFRPRGTDPCAPAAAKSRA